MSFKYNIDKKIMKIKYNAIVSVRAQRQPNQERVSSDNRPLLV
jgi:hypothetical protein